MDGHGSLTLKTNNIVLDEQHCERNGGCVPGEYVQLAVSDTGGGIPSEHMKDLFDPFFTTKETTGGAGLGLAMVYDFCQRSRGHIKVDSEQGTGTTFRLYLPRLDGPGQPEQA
jgi:signal transduction histidine kinase